MVNWQEKAEQARQLSQQSKATKGTVDSGNQLDPREIDRKRKEHGIQMLSRFDQFNIKGMLEDLNKTTPDVWGGLGEITQGEILAGKWERSGNYIRAASDLLMTTCYLQLGGHYTIYDKREESIYGMRKGRYHKFIQTGGYSGVPHGQDGVVGGASGFWKETYGSHEEKIGFREVVTSEEKKDRGLIVQVSYFSEHDSYDIYIDDREVNLKLETRHNPLKHGSESAGYYQYPKDPTYLPTQATLDNFPLSEAESGISLPFEAKFFDNKIDTIKSFLETSLLISIYLRKDRGHSLVERVKIKPPIVSSPVYYA